MDPRFSSTNEQSTASVPAVHAEHEDDSSTDSTYTGTTVDFHSTIITQAQPGNSSTAGKKRKVSKKYNTLKYEQPIAPQRPLLAANSPDAAAGSGGGFSCHLMYLFRRMLCCFPATKYQIDDKIESDVTQSIMTQVQRPTKQQQQPAVANPYHNNGAVPDNNPISSVSRTTASTNSTIQYQNNIAASSSNNTTGANAAGATVVASQATTTTAATTTFTTKSKARTNRNNSGDDKSYGFLGPQPLHTQGKKTLVLDLDETLVHSSFRPVSIADFIVDIEIDGEYHKVYVCKRPGVDEFLRDMGQYFEVVVFTASLSKYADPVLDRLDIHKVVTGRLFREHCSFWNGNFIKDLAKLGRDLSQILIIDNSPISYLKHPANAMAVTSWFDQQEDIELDLIRPWLHRLASDQEVYQSLEFFQKLCTNGNIATVETMDSIINAAEAEAQAEAEEEARAEQQFAAAELAQQQKQQQTLANAVMVST